MRAQRLAPPSASYGHHTDTAFIPARFEIRLNTAPSMDAGKNGERGRNRTYNLLIKSQLLCQLSYAPTVGMLQEGRNKNYNIRSPWQPPHPRKVRFLNSLTIEGTGTQSKARITAVRAENVRVAPRSRCGRYVLSTERALRLLLHFRGKAA